MTINRKNIENETLDHEEMSLKDLIISTKDWFNFFLPTPTELKDEGWYEWNVQNWGCKWNCDAQDWMKVENPNDDELQLALKELDYSNA